MVQFVVSSDEEGDGEPTRPEGSNIGETNTDVPQPMGPQSGEGGEAGSAPSTVAQGLAPDKFGPSVPPANIRARDTAVGEDTPRPSSPTMAAGEDAATPADVPGPSSTPATDFRDSREGPSVDPTSQGEGSGVVSLFDFSPAELLNHFISNDIYFGEGWGQVKGKSCNSKMEFFFNCHSLVISFDVAFSLSCVFFI